MRHLRSGVELQVGDTIVVGNDEAEPGVVEVHELVTGGSFCSAYPRARSMRTGTVSAGDLRPATESDKPQGPLASRPERAARAKRRPMIDSKSPVAATCALGSKKAWTIGKPNTPTRAP